MMYSKNICLPFGQYKGLTVNEIIELDPKYLLWCMKNVKDFDLDPITYQRTEEAVMRDAADDSFDPATNWLSNLDDIPF